MPNPRKFAAVAPLDYEGRIENLVMYYSTDWEELAALVEAPAEFMRAQQFFWHQNAVDSVPWQLLTPVTATFECGYSNEALFMESVTKIGPGFFGNKFQNLTPSQGNGDQLKSLIVDMRGSFLVEFSPYTNAVRVLYYPPGVPEEDRYIGGFADPTMVTASYDQKGSFSTVHFDLKMHSARMRADHIMQLMECPEYLPAWLTSKAKVVDSTSALKSVSYTMEEGGSAGNRPDLPPAEHRTGPPRDLKFSAPVGRIEDPYQEFAAYPKITAHNLSLPEQCYVCTVTDCKPHQTGHTIGSITIESYCRARYDMGFVIDDHMKKS